MASSINTVALSGNLVRDFELKGNSGKFGTFSIAVNERAKNRETGEWEDVAHYFDCVLLGARASSLAQYLTKGTTVAVTGKLEQNRWQAQDGTNRSAVRVVVSELVFMRGKGGGQQYQQPQQQSFANADVPF